MACNATDCTDAERGKTSGSLSRWRAGALVNRKNPATNNVTGALSGVTMRSLLATLFACLTVVSTTASVQPDDDHPAKVELLANVSSIKPGEPFTVGVRFTMKPHWHVYWLNPGDSGMPPEVKWKLPEGFTVSELQFPVPKKFEQQGDMVGYGYEDEVLLTATVTPPMELKQGARISIAADVNWMVCQDVCQLGDAKLSINLLVSDKAVSAHAETFSAWLARLPQPAETVGAEIQFATDPVSSNMYIIVKWEDRVPANVQWFPPPSDHIEFRGIRTLPTHKSTTVSGGFKLLTKKHAPEEILYSLLVYDGRDGARHGVVVPFQVGKNNASIPSN